MGTGISAELRRPWARSHTENTGPGHFPGRMSEGKNFLTTFYTSSGCSSEKAEAGRTSRSRKKSEKGGMNSFLIAKEAMKVSNY